MKEAFGISRLDLNQIVKRGIKHVQHRTRAAYRCIGPWIGYPDGRMIEAAMHRDDVLFASDRLAAASRLFSYYDFDALSDCFSCEGKRTLAVPLTFDAALNGSLDDEAADNTEAIGQALSAYRAGRFDEAARCAKRGIGILFRLLAEIDAQRDGGPSPTGDALPTESITLR